MRVRWDESNQRWEASLGSGKARRWLRSRVEGEAGRQLVEAKLKAILDGPEPLPAGSLAEFIEQVWWPMLKIPGKTTMATRKGYKRNLDKHLAVLQPLPITSLDVGTLQAFVASLTDQGLSGKSVRNIFGTLTSCLGYAHKLGRIPNQDYKLVVLPEADPYEAQTLTAIQIGKLVAAAREHRPECEGPIWIAANAALRANEMQGLKRSQVKVLSDRAEIHLQDNRQSHGEEPKLKGKKKGQVRILTIPKEWGVRLLEYGDPESIYIFNYQGRPLAAGRASKAMPRLCELAGVPRARFHDLRHSCATNLREKGVPETVIQRAILGHASMSTTMRYLDDRSDEVLAAFARLTSKG